MLYTEEFKKQVVRKVLSPGVSIKDITRKLRISATSVHSWKKQYGDEIKSQIIQIDIEKLLYEEPVDIEKLLLDAEPDRERQELEALQRIDKGITPGQYKTIEKYVIINHLKKLSVNEQGVFLRSYGLQNRHIEQWRDEILTAGKKNIDQGELIKRLEAENKQLKKELKEAKQEKHELEFLISVKKKYPTIFKQDGED